MCTKFDEFLKALGKKGKIYNNFLKIVPGVLADFVSGLCGPGI